MAAGATYEPIATTTFASTATSYIFSSIPATYTDLVLIFKGSLTTGTAIPILRFNSDSTSIYSDTTLYGHSTASYGGGGDSNSGNIYVTGADTLSTGISQLILNVQNYANSTTYKTVISKYGDAGTGLSVMVGTWRSTSAINAITIGTHNGSSFSIGSTFTLYGIAAA